MVSGCPLRQSIFQHEVYDFFQGICHKGLAMRLPKPLPFSKLKEQLFREPYSSVCKQWTVEAAYKVTDGTNNKLPYKASNISYSNTKNKQ